MSALLCESPHSNLYTSQGRFLNQSSSLVATLVVTKHMKNIAINLFTLCGVFVVRMT
jgi:hypothetical protein